MNTKGMKFLAVLAVLAMAFAAFAVIAPAETDDATATEKNSSFTVTAAAGAQDFSVTGGGDVVITLTASATSTDVGAIGLYIVKNTTVKICITTAVDGSSAYMGVVTVYAIDSSSTTPAALGTLRLVIDTSKAITEANAVTLTVNADGSAITTNPSIVKTGSVYAVGMVNSATSVTYYNDEQTIGASAASAIEYVSSAGDSIKIKNGTGTPTIGLDTNMKITLGAAFNGELTVTGGILKLNVADATYTIGNGTDATSVTVDSGAELNIVTTAATFAGKTTVKVDGTLDADVALTMNANSVMTISESGLLDLLSALTMNADNTNTSAANYGAKLTNEGNIVGAGVATSTITVNHSTVTGANYKASKNATFITSTTVTGVGFEGDGNIELDTIEVLRVSDKLASSFTTQATQKVLLIGNLNIKKDQVLTITGGLEVPEGITLTIEEGGQLVITGAVATADISGTIRSASSVDDGGLYVTNTVSDGNIQIPGKLIASKSGTDNAVTVKIAGSVTVTGSFEVASKAYATVGAGLYVAEGAKMTVSGGISATSAMNLGGELTFNGAVGTAASHEFTVNIMASGATIVVDQVKAGKISVTDANMYLATVDGTAYTVDAENSAHDVVGWAPTVNTMTVQNIKGITIKEETSSKNITEGTMQGKTLPVTNLYVNGATSVATNTGIATYLPQIQITNAAAVKVNESLDLTKAQITIAGGATLSVSGEMYVSAETITGDNITGLSGTGKLSVTGIITAMSNEIPTTLSITAVEYETRVDNVTAYIYTNLTDALASGATDLTVHGTLTVSKSTTIPAGITIDAPAAVKVGKNADATSVVLTVADGATLNVAGTTTVNGTLVIENTNTGGSFNTIVSDTSVIGESTAKYTNIYTALGGAVAGETVKITKTGDGIVKVTKNITVPEGVTLDVPSGKTLKILENITMTIDGTLNLKGTLAGYYTQGGDEKSTAIWYEEASFDDTVTHYAAIVVVNGKIVSTDQIAYDATAPAANATNKAIVGAYLEMSGKYIITTPETASELILSTPDYVVSLYGAQSIGEVSFIGTDSKQVTVNVNGNITAKGLYVVDGAMNFDNDVVMNGTFGTADGSATFANVQVATSLQIKDSRVSIDGANVDAMVYEGTVNNDQTDTHATGSDLKAMSITFGGLVAIKEGSTFNMGYNHPTGYGTLTDVKKAGSITVDGTLALIGGTTSVGNGSVTVNGTLWAENGAIFTLPAAGGNTTLATPLNVLGDVVIAEQSSTVNAAGTFTAKTIYIGGTSYSLYTAAAAGFDGKVTFTTIYLFPGSTVEGALAEVLADEDTKSTAYYIDGDLWLTVYGTANIATHGADTSYTYDITPKKDNATFASWQYMYSGKLYDVSASSADVKVGDYSTVYAKYNYEIYTVKVTTDAGIKAVSIDGIEMVWNGQNQFNQLTPIAAGTHTITFTLKNGYEADANGVQLYTADGTILKDHKFVTSGTDDTAISLLLNGTEQIVTPEPSPVEQNEWTITTILLVILVILIAVMAVIVALRLNRS